MKRQLLLFGYFEDGRILATVRPAPQALAIEELEPALWGAG
jgi:hypothetical protein